MADRRLAVLGAGLVVAGIVAMSLGAVFGSGPGSTAGQDVPWGLGPGGMMGVGAANVSSAPDPVSPGFTAGTASAPRIIHVIASEALRFYPDVVTVKAGETITFEVTAMGMAIHEFMVGQAADVAADTAGTPEATDISMMQTKSLTYTFNGPGPFAFACHAPGHYEARMRGTITVVP